MKRYIQTFLIFLLSIPLVCYAGTGDQVVEGYPGRRPDRKPGSFPPMPVKYCQVQVFPIG